MDAPRKTSEKMKIPLRSGIIVVTANARTWKSAVIRKRKPVVSLALYVIVGNLGNWNVPRWAID